MEFRDPAAKRYQGGPIDAGERRVLGVLIEKAKTTPEAYPLTLNSARTGSNQKSNRSPQMEMDEDRTQAALDSLRKRGAVAVIEGSGRVDKYRHLAYEWFGVDKFELAVLAELLLRGAQTLGELRTRASRMELIRGQDGLHPIVESLHGKGLLLFLSRPGRGNVVTHNLYHPHELEKLCREEGAVVSGHPSLSVQPLEAAGEAVPPPASPHPASQPPAPQPQASQPATFYPPGAGPAPVRASVAPPSRDDAAAEETVLELRRHVQELRTEIAALRIELTGQVDDLRRQVEDLHHQVRG